MLLVLLLLLFGDDRPDGAAGRGIAVDGEDEDSRDGYLGEAESYRASEARGSEEESAGIWMTRTMIKLVPRRPRRKKYSKMTIRGGGDVMTTTTTTKERKVRASVEKEESGVTGKGTKLLLSWRKRN